MMNGYCPPGQSKDVYGGGQDPQAMASALAMLMQMMGGQAGQDMPPDDDPDPMRAGARQNAAPFWDTPSSMY